MSEPTSFSPAATINADEPNRRALPSQTVVGRPKAGALAPDVALLSNGRYHAMITASGAGSSSWQSLDVTRWHADATRDCWGQFIYVRDLCDGTHWSIGQQPLCQAADQYEVVFHADRAEFRRRDADIETRADPKPCPQRKRYDSAALAHDRPQVT